MSEPTGHVNEHPLDDLAAYALDALDDTERRAVDDHLAHCPACRAELAGHHETLAVLAPPEAPPASVWAGIAASIGTPDATGPGAPTASLEVQDRSHAPGASNGAGADDADDGAADAGPAATSPFADARARRQLPSLRWLAAAACLLAAAALGGAFGFVLGSSDDDADIGTLAEQASQDPGGVLATLADSSGQPVAQVVADEDGAYVVLNGLDNLPEGRAYQLWSIGESGEAVSLGMLGRDGTNTVAFRLPPTITELAISVAPTSGDVAPNGGFQATGDVARSS